MLFWRLGRILKIDSGKAFQKALFVYTMGKLFLEAL
jgi:hypothetical protein